VHTLRDTHQTQNVSINQQPKIIKMASSFWYLDDGRSFARRTSIMMEMISLIHKELSRIEDAKEFSNYISKFVPDENCESNGFSGFYNLETKGNVELNFDLREFTKENISFFWAAVLKAKKNIQDENSVLSNMFSILLDMNSRIKRNEIRCC